MMRKGDVVIAGMMGIEHNGIIEPQSSILDDPGTCIWVASCEKVPNGLSRCHTKRRMGF